MPLYMDIHHLSGGVACSEVAEAHKADLQAQGPPRRALPALLGG